MGWRMYRWVWQVEAPLHLGMPPAGLLNRTRLYAPARTLLGALTAELTRVQAKGPLSPNDYEEVARKLGRATRLTYLFPAQRKEGKWLAWLPRHEEGKGLVWRREDGRGPVADREFRSWLLTTRAGTAIDPFSDSALEGSLREHEVVQPWSRWGEGSTPEPVFLLGYVFVRGEDGGAFQVKELFLGGETRYGLGRVRRVNLEETKRGGGFFSEVHLEGEDLEVCTQFLLAHLPAAKTPPASMSGALEQIAGWQGEKPWSLSLGWAPGSELKEGRCWRIKEDGLWSPAT
ncbi:hypothetical protein [Thermus sp.]|jgi:hypothetical protein|uniref:hypothetical protein n=1 Tax=Thermus sp. TaxID=275 RepID=UPI00321F884C